MTDRSRRMLAELDAAAIQTFLDFLTRLDDALKDDQYIVWEGRRSMQVQEAYYMQGRKTLEEVNWYREKAGLYLLRSSNDNYVITWTLKSKHIDGFAMDVLPVNGSGNPTWDLAHYRSKFETIRNCGRAVGLECGADWPAKNKDWPHYEIKQAG